MKMLIAPFVIAVIIGAGMASYSYAVDDKAIPTIKTVKGDLLKIDGEFYVVKDMAGKEIRLRVDKATALDVAVKVGDKVEIQATEMNHAASITHVQPKM